MLYETYEIPKRRLPKTWVTVVLAVGILGLIGTVAFTHSSSKNPLTLSAAEPAQRVSGWRMTVSGDERNKGGQTFSGRFAPNSIFFVPSSASFGVAVEPRELEGRMVEPSGIGSWSQEGGLIGDAVESPDGWRQELKAPSQPGLYQLKWQSANGNTASLEVLVTASAETRAAGERTMLKVNGKSIGGYLDPAQSSIKRVKENAKQYQFPRQFVTLNPQTIGLKLGEDFELGDLVAFIDEYTPDGKKIRTNRRHTDVLPIRMELVDKLIKLRARLRAKGIPVTKFGITSGFRTPDYNARIKGAAYSRHCYGDAVDLFIDENNDHKMDDVNGDGKQDRKDGLVIAQACRELEEEGEVIAGGIGVYEWDGDESVKSHVHIDCRGYASRWSQAGSGRFKKQFIWWPKGDMQEDDTGE